MKATAFSRRYYPDDINGYGNAVNAIIQLNDIKFQAYDAYYNNRFGLAKGADPLKNTTLYDFIRKLGLNSLYANVMEPFVKGILKSQQSNRKNYTSDVKADIESRKEKLSGIVEQKENAVLLKKAIESYMKTGTFAKPYPRCSVKISEDGTVFSFGNGPMPAAEFERHTEARIRKLKNRISMMEEGIRRQEKRFRDMETLPPRKAIFGTRSLYRKKDTAPYEKWHDDFLFARHRSFTVSGRADSIHGNFLVKFNPQENSLEWTLPDGGSVVFQNFRLGHYDDEFRTAFKKRGSPIAYTFERRKDGSGKEFLIVKAAFEFPSDGRLNNSLSDGCIAYDTNYDRFAWAELDADGNVLRHGNILFDIDGKTKGQVSDIIGRAAAQLVSIASCAKKPLIREALDPAAMRRGMRYQDKTRNRKIYMFACEKMAAMVKSRAFRKDIDVMPVNPAYTSFQAKTTLLRKMGISVHEGAAIMIGRRALDILPSPPEWADAVIGSARSLHRSGLYQEWKKLYKEAKNLRTHDYYREFPVFSKKKDFNAWVDGLHKNAAE